MPKIAILSDIHANLVALETVLNEVRHSGAEQIYFLGDTVGYGSHPAECVEWVRKLGGKSVMGNHDVEIPAYRKPGFKPMDRDWKKNEVEAGLMHAAAKLNDEQAEWISKLPYVMKIPGALLVHATFHEPEEFDYIEDLASAEPSLALLKKQPQKVGFVGHTHIQNLFVSEKNHVEWINNNTAQIAKDVPCIVNVGSVGQPREAHDFRAGWVLWNPEERIVEFKKTEYKRTLAAKHMLEAGLPMEGALRLLKDHELSQILR